MSNKITRNITGTKLRGEKKEPFHTNVQNDLLSDETDVYIRQERSSKIDDTYHCLTDNVKEVISKSDLLTTENFDHDKDEQDKKGKSYISVNKASKTDSENMTSNSKVMTPLQTGYSIEKNNRDKIPALIKEHETETKITSKSDELIVTKKGKNDYELEIEIKTSENGDIEITSDSELINIEQVDGKKFNISFNSGKFYTVANSGTKHLNSNFDEALINVIGKNTLSHVNISNIVNSHGTPLPPNSFIRSLITLEEFKVVTNRLAKRIIDLENRVIE